MQRWLIKLEDEGGGRGIAWVDVGHVHGLTDELSTVQDSLAALVDLPSHSLTPPAWPSTEGMSYEQAAPFEELRAQGEASVARVLLARLSKALQIANRRAFSSYRAYVQVCVCERTQHIHRQLYLQVSFDQSCCANV